MRLVTTRGINDAKICTKLFALALYPVAVAHVFDVGLNALSAVYINKVEKFSSFYLVTIFTITSAAAAATAAAAIVVPTKTQ